MRNDNTVLFPEDTPNNSVLFPEEEENQNISFGDILQGLISRGTREQKKQVLSEFGGRAGEAIAPYFPYLKRTGQAAGLGVVPALEQVVPGVYEGLERSHAGLTGGKFKEMPIPNEYGASLGRSVGQTIGQGIPVGAATLAGGAFGGPVGALAGLFGSTAATTPGGIGKRAKEAAIATTLPLVPKFAKGAIKSALKGINRYRTKPQQQALLDANAQFLAKEQEEKEAQNLASHLFGQQKKERLDLMAKDKAKELEEGRRLLSTHAKPEMYQMLPGEQTVGEAQFRAQNISDALKNLLGEGKNNIQNLSRSIVNEIEGVPVMEPHPKTGFPREVRKGGIREEIGNKYESLESGLPKEIEVPGATDMESVEKEVQSYLNQNPNISDEAKEQLKEVAAKTHSSSKSKLVNGRAYFRAYRTLRKLEGDQRSKAYSHGITPEAHDLWMERANRTKQTYENMEKTINDHFPKDTIHKLHEINHEYATRVAPLHENPMYQQMLHHGNYGGNVLEYLTGTTKGNDILRNMIQKNPEYTRLAIGDQFASKPESLLNPNETLSQYQSIHPEVSRLMGLQREAQQGLEKAEANAPITEQIIKNRQLQEEIVNMNRLSSDLKRISKEKNASKESVKRAEEALDKSKKRIERIKRALPVIGKTTAWSLPLGTASALGTYIGNKLSEK
jgi:hypothetical protein